MTATDTPSPLGTSPAPPAPAPGSDTPARAAGHRPPELQGRASDLIRRLTRAHHAAWARYVDDTVTAPQFSVLRAVARDPRADQGSIAASVGLDRSTMADICRRLEARHLLARSPTPDDGRRKLLTVTLHGLEVLHGIEPRAHALEDMVITSGEPGTPERTPLDRAVAAGAPLSLEWLGRFTERWERLGFDQGAERP